MYILSTLKKMRQTSYLIQKMPMLSISEWAENWRIHKPLGKITVGRKGIKGQARNARRTNGFVTGVRAALVLSDARAAAQRGGAASSTGGTAAEQGAAESVAAAQRSLHQAQAPRLYAGGVKRPQRYRPGTVALRKNRKSENST